MTTNNDGGPAFPMPSVFNEGLHVHAQEYGMTLRDYFAAKAMQMAVIRHTPERIAKDAYELADAMLAVRGINTERRK